MNTPMMNTFTNNVPGAPNGKTEQKRPFPQGIQGRVLFHGDDEVEEKYQPGIMDAPIKKRVRRNQVLPYPLSLGTVLDSVEVDAVDAFGGFTWNTEVEEVLNDVQFDPSNFRE